MVVYLYDVIISVMNHFNLVYKISQKVFELGLSYLAYLLGQKSRSHLKRIRLFL